MKKTLIVLVVGLLAVGCLTPGQKRPGVFRIPPEALRDSVVGEYEHKYPNEVTLKWVFLANGIVERYINGDKTSQYGWTIVNGEILHIEAAKTVTWVFRINKDRSITSIAEIEDGKRKDAPKDGDYTAKKIK